MTESQYKTLKTFLLATLSFLCFCMGTVAFAQATSTSGVGLGLIATNVTSNLSAVAKLMTAGSYVAGMGFAIGAILKFKAHKDAPTQITIGTPIALVFVAASLIFLPSIFKASGQTMFGSAGGNIAGVSGITAFGVSHA